MTPQRDPQAPCPCGTGQNYGDCCQPFHQGRPAATPEALMRSRFSAFVIGDTDYLTVTWHPQTRPRDLNLAGSPDWTSLRILGHEERGHQGEVHFQAFYREDPSWGCLEENSRFEKIEGRWFYLEGETRQSLYRPGRNEKCPCGSGRKAKACCGA